MEENKECCHKKKERSEKEYKDLLDVTAGNQSAGGEELI